MATATASIRIYNSLTRKKEALEPLHHPQINIYTCGVTVYDECHIGHARSLYIFEVMRRYLEYRGFTVNFVRNITDIDDKIINRANELKIDWQVLVKKYIESYHEDLKLLGVRKGALDADGEEPCATKNIPQMVSCIASLIEKGYAYVTATGVYFSVRRFKDYGKLSGQGIDQMRAGARISPDEKKQDPLDFALWKSAKADEPAWESPWGKGRPGWHIECSVMSQRFLKTNTIDIHAGGRDLIFPHHENEIAQAEAHSNELFARCWVHHGLLTINGQKMSKSLGNFITIKDFASRNDIDLLKLFFLSTHYLHPIDYTEPKIDEARKQKRLFSDFFARANNWRFLQKKQRPAPTKKDMSGIDNICAKFSSAMDDDFNAPQALACLFELIDLGSALVSQDKEAAFNQVEEKLKEYLYTFGITIQQGCALDSEFDRLVETRHQAKLSKDYQKADTIRREIEAMFNGNLSDTAGGITFIKRE